jgi:hypothetical protein
MPSLETISPAGLGAVTGGAGSLGAVKNSAAFIAGMYKTLGARFPHVRDMLNNPDKLIAQHLPDGKIKVHLPGAEDKGLTAAPDVMQHVFGREFPRP